MEKKVDIEAYKYLEELCNGETVRIITIRGKDYRIKGLRAKAMRMISGKIIGRKIVSEDAKPIEVRDAMSKYFMVPYEVFAIALLNNNLMFLLFPFIYKIYAWWLSNRITQEDIAVAIQPIARSMNIDGFFFTITKLETSLDIPLKMTKSLAAALLVNAPSEKKST